ncbi:MAG: cupin domain-containing protein [Desulfobacterales bacterium]|jgi:UDP-2-acetamido-2,6-beta-L-arabino-hexul-4-ose reductase
MKVNIDQLKTLPDLRGIVFEPIDKDKINSQENIHVVISEPGAVRGNHYHLRGTETLAVVGPALIRFKENDELHDFEVPSGQVYKFIIPPKVVHAIKNIGDKPSILVAFNTVEHNPQNPDQVRENILN